MKKSILLATGFLLWGMSVHAVTFNVRVPDGTPKVYVCGDFNGWDISNCPQLDDLGNNLFTLTLPDVSEADAAKGYKYVCGRDWKFVEKDASGGEISNRTSIGNPDVVESWANLNLWEIETADITINGIPRQISVYLPKGYEESTESYPVIYYNTVQQRYSNAGDDNDNGDNFFGTLSWNAQATMENQREETGKAYIMVQICSMLAENTVSENEDYKGTGDADNYLREFVNVLMPYVQDKWRVKTGKENTTLVGADFGALFSLYGAVCYPEIFGNCVVMSPMLWINEGDFETLALNAEAGQTYYVSAGSKEPEWVINQSRNLAQILQNIEGVNAYFTLYQNAAHNDDDWGVCFGSILEAMAGNKAPVSPANLASKSTTAISPLSAVRSEDFKNRSYTVYGGEDSDNLTRLGNMVYTEDYRKNGTDTPVAAFVFTNDIPVEYKSKYYWNITEGDNSDNWVISSPKSIGFSDKKSETSWHNIAVLEDGSVSDIAAHSKGFRVVAGNNTYMMDQAGNHVSKQTVSFPSADKSFKIHYGSVNSSSDMGAITPSFNVSDNCLEAEITYDFNLNKVIVNETKTGDAGELLKVMAFTATPSVAAEGTPVKLILELNKNCQATVICEKLDNSQTPVSLEGNGASYSAILSGLKEGVYTLRLSLNDGVNEMTDAAPLNVIITPSSQKTDKELTVNAYENINWDNIGRYKSNFHTHTSQSFDTQYTTTEVVDKYQAAGYKILALTDHDANPYPWSMFSLYNANAQDRDADSMGMLSIPGNELSKDRRNSWSESTGGEFNHHNDFFTGRKGQEFMSLRESYAYSQAIGGLQIINHPGQYWNLSTEYKNGEKNSPEWHAENFRLFDSLIGLEVYNQGNRRPNDRILWDQVLTINMPENPVWGYSCDDTHTAEQYFRNYQYMLMPELSVEDLKDAMRNGNTVFSYEFTGSGKALAPYINEIEVDEENKTITIDSDDADNIEWIYSTYRTGTAASTTKSAVVGYGKTFNYSGYQGSYVRARLTNSYGETATQPFGFNGRGTNSIEQNRVEKSSGLTVISTPGSDEVTLICTEPMIRISVVNTAGNIVKYMETNSHKVSFTKSEFANGVYVIVAATEFSAYTGKIIK